MEMSDAQRRLLFTVFRWFFVLSKTGSLLQGVVAILLPWTHRMLRGAANMLSKTETPTRDF